MTKAEDSLQQLEDAFQEAKQAKLNIQYLLNAIDALSNNTDNVILRISAFNLKSQYIEFRVKEIIPTLSLLTELPAMIRIQKVRPSKITFQDIESMQFGNTIGMFERFYLPELDLLIHKLKLLKKTRNNLTHYLFSHAVDLPKTAKRIRYDINLADEIISEIDELSNNLSRELRKILNSDEYQSFLHDKGIKI